jgi:hypothetical protein
MMHLTSKGTGIPETSSIFSAIFAVASLRIDEKTLGDFSAKKTAPKTDGGKENIFLRSQKNPVS